MEVSKGTLDQKLKRLKRQIDEDVALARYKDISLKKKFAINKEVKIVLTRLALEKVEPLQEDDEPLKENRKKYDLERPLKCPYCGAGYKQKFSLRRHIHTQCSRAKSIDSRAKVILSHQTQQIVTPKPVMNKIVIQSVTPECVTIVTPNNTYMRNVTPEVVTIERPPKPSNQIVTREIVTKEKVVTIVTPSGPIHTGQNLTIRLDQPSMRPLAPESSQVKEPTQKPPRKSLPPLIPIKDSDDTSEPKVPEEPSIPLVQLPSEPILPTIQLPTEPILPSIQLPTEPVLHAIPLPTEPVLPLQSGPQWSFKCDTCGELFKSEESLRTHEKYIHNYIKHHKVQSTIAFSNTEDPIQCNICGEVFMSESSLRTHEKWIHNVNKDVIQCPHCGLKMQHKKYLRRHLEKECNPAVRPFKCPYCDADYKQKFSLTRHINSQCAKAKSSNNVASVAPNPPSSGVSIQAQATSYVPILPKLPMEPLTIVYIDASEPKAPKVRYI